MELMLYQELMEKIITSTFSTLILKKIINSLSLIY